MPFSRSAVTQKNLHGPAMVGSYLGGPMKLLLIEDDKLVARVLAEAFEAEGHETTVMQSGGGGPAHLPREGPGAGRPPPQPPRVEAVALPRQARAQSDELSSGRLPRTARTAP